MLKITNKKDVCSLIDHKSFLQHNQTMTLNQRKAVRYNDFGRAECEEICPVAGVLGDISVSGCKIHYDAPVDINLENDYEIHLRLSRFISDPLFLMCHPQWQRELEDGAVEIGFVFLRSPDTLKLESYINQLQAEQKSSDLDSYIVQEDSCQFV